MIVVLIVEQLVRTPLDMAERWSKLRDQAGLLYDSLEDGVTSVADAVSAQGARAWDRASRATEPVVATASVVSTCAPNDREVAQRGASAA